MFSRNFLRQPKLNYDLELGSVENGIEAISYDINHDLPSTTPPVPGSQTEAVGVPPKIRSRAGTDDLDEIVVLGEEDPEIQDAKSDITSTSAKPDTTLQGTAEKKTENGKVEKEDNKKHAVIRGAIFFPVFALHFIYFSGFTMPWWGASMIAFLFAAVYSLAFMASKVFRCCIAVYLPSLLSGYGLVLGDAFVTWWIARSPIEGILWNLKVVVDAEDRRRNVTKNSLLDNISHEWLYFNHFMLALPYVELFITAVFVYQFNMEMKSTTSKNVTEESSAEGVRRFGYKVQRSFISHILGGFIVGMSVIFYFEHKTAQVVASKFPSQLCREASTGLLLWFGFKSVLVVLVRPFHEDFTEMKRNICFYMLAEKTDTDPQSSAGEQEDGGLTSILSAEDNRNLARYIAQLTNRGATVPDLRHTQFQRSLQNGTTNNTPNPLLFY